MQLGHCHTIHNKQVNTAKLTYRTSYHFSLILTHLEMFLIIAIVDPPRHFTTTASRDVARHNYHRAEHDSLDDDADCAHSLREIHRRYLSHLQPLIQQ